MINEDIEIKIMEISNERIKIGIEAPRTCKVIRKELRQTVENNQKAARSTGRKAELLNFFAQRDGKGPCSPAAQPKKKDETKQ